MILNWDEIKIEPIEKILGGEGTVFMQTFNDGECKIVKVTVPPGAAFGRHTHSGTCEVVYIIQGKGKVVIDDGEEPLSAGSVHYCPNGHNHAVVNDSDENLVLLGIVPNFNA